MNANEGMSLAKMAITVLLVILVMGAFVALFWLMFRGFDNYHNETTKSINTSAKSFMADLMEQSISADGLYTFSTSNPADYTDQDIKNYKALYEAHPLVSTVADALGNYQDADVKFVYISMLDMSKNNISEIYTRQGEILDYNFVNTPGVTDGVFLENYDAGSTVIHAEHEDCLVPATKRLLQYAQYRCHVETFDIKERNGSGATSNFVGVKIFILNDKGII